MNEAVKNFIKENIDLINNKDWEKVLSSLAFITSNVKNEIVDVFLKSGVNFLDGVERIPTHAFSFCRCIEKIELPDTIQDIRSRAFFNCDNLRSIKLPNNIETIHSGTFRMCKSLPNITIPDGIKVIGVSAFADCDNLVSITIPNTVTNIDANAFKGCENLEEVVLPASIKLISRYAFMTESNNLTIKYAKSSDDFAHLDMMYNSFDPTAIIQCTDKTATFREITDDVWDWSKI